MPKAVEGFLETKEGFRKGEQRPPRRSGDSKDAGSYFDKMGKILVELYHLASDVTKKTFGKPLANEKTK